MNQKEVSELRRRWRVDKNAVSRIYGCYVNSNKEIVSNLDESLGTMPEEEAEKYLGLLKKSLSGALGKNLIDIVFSTQQVMESEEHKLLSALRSSALKDGQTRETFYRKVIDRLDMGGNNYLLLMACDSYDVPHRGKDGEVQADGSETVFNYILCCVCPVKMSRPELNYFPGDNEFHYTAGQVVSAPELGFLFPAFDDRTANIYNALFYSRKSDELHQEFIDAVFHTEPPMSAEEQREAFESALTEALEGACPLEVVQAIHEQLREKIEARKEDKDAEPLAVTPAEVAEILERQGVSQDQAASFQKECAERFGENAALNPENLIDSKRFEVRAGEAKVTVDPSCSYLVETRVIDGVKYLLIPAGNDVEVNGLPVQVGGTPEESE